MKSGDLDTLIRIYRPGALARQGRSRVAGAEALVAECLAQYLPAVGSERFASEQNISTAPAVFIIRREPDVEAVDATCTIALLDLVDGVMVERERFDIKSARPWPKDPRWGLELSGVSSSAS